jgi:hypothetical protein
VNQQVADGKRNGVACDPPKSPYLPPAPRAASRLQRRREPAKPLANEREPTRIDGIHASPPAPLLSQEARVLEHTQVTGRRRPFVGKATGNFACSRLTAEMDSQKDLPSSRVRQAGYNGVKRREFRGGAIRQSGSTSQIVSSSSTGPIGSHTAMTSGVWWAISLARPSFHTKCSMNCSRRLRMS